MNRLEKKSFITATSAHGLLFLILFVGPGFFMPSDRENSFHEVTVYSAADITKALSSGGTPENVRAVPSPPSPIPAAEPKPVEPTPKPPVIPPEPKPEPVVKVEHGDDPVRPKRKHQVTLNDIELTPSKPDKNKQKQADEDARKAKAAADAKRLAAAQKQIGNALKTLRSNLSGRTTIKFDPGVGGGGKAAVNYFELVESILRNAWHPSDTLGEDTPTVTISIIISRDGTVKGHITKPSGNRLMDRSVQNVLETVTSVEPFPADLTEQQIPATFTFDIKAKR